MEIIFYFVSILLPITNAYVPTKGCSLSLHGNWEKYSPLLLKGDSFIYPSSTKNIHLLPQENITLVCPDPKNYITFTHKNYSIADCEKDSSLRIGKQKINFEDVQCKKIIRGVVLSTTEICGLGVGYIYHIGYFLPNKSFFTLITLCYDYYYGTTLYTRHIIDGKYTKSFSRTNYRPTFSPEKVNPNIAIALAYKQTFQKSTFNSLLGSAILSKKYIFDNSYLSRGHLSPDADFLFAAWQYSTYYFINTSPQWQVINSGNWKKIEQLVRKCAENYREAFEIITGNYGVLTLEDVNGKQTPIYLASEEKMPVPKYMWKIVYSKINMQAIVLVILNNPFIDIIQETDIFCNDICISSGWNVDSWVNSSKGYVYCCSYNDFIKTVQMVPKLKVRGILEGIL